MGQDGKDWKDEAYEAGVHKGQEGGFLDDLAHDLGKTIPRLTESGELFDKGYEYGRDHRSEGDASDSESSSEESSSSGGLCILSTACTESRGLADDCYELTVLRKYRDAYVARLPEGTQLLQEYYATAPRVVAEVRRRPDGAHILEQTFVTLVVPAVRLIEAGKERDALALYTRRFRELQSLL